MKKHFYTILFSAFLLLNISIFAQSPSGAGITFYGIGALGEGKPSLSTGNNNSAFGHTSLFNNTTGLENTAVGQAALYSNTIGRSNTALGCAALANNISGVTNTAVGMYSLTYNTTANNNVGVGYRTLFFNTTGENNVAIGLDALYSNTTAGSNTAVGYRAMVGNTTGNFNSALGNGSLASNTIGYHNSGIGNASLLANTTGYYNTALGSGAMEKNTEGSENTTTGVLSLHYNTTGLLNSSYGFQSMHENRTGSANTAYGGYSLQRNQTGSENVAIGKYALASNVSASGNVAVGSNALSSSSDADKNTAVGYSSMQKTSTGIHNTALGYYSLVLNTTGGNNSILGSEAMYFNTTGQNNTAIGKSALGGNKTGNNNTAIGAFANASSEILNNTTSIGAYSKVDCSGCLVLGSVNGQNNATETVRTGIGTTNPNSKSALDIVSTNRGVLIPRMTTTQKAAISPEVTETGLLIYQTDGISGFQYYNGTNWTALGGSGTSGWGLNGNSGTDVTTNFIGTTDNKDLIFKVNNNNAGRLSSTSNNSSWGNNSQSAITTGTNNTAIGVNALGLNKTGNNNTAVGYNTVIGTATSTAFSNSTAIGNGATVNASNKVVIGNTSVTSIGGQVSWTKFSDGRYKKNIKEDVPGIQFIKALRPVTYSVDYNNLDSKLNQQNGSNHKQTKETGFIAQEVEKAAKKIGYDFSGVDKPENDQESFYGLRYEEFVVPLVKAVQELSAENETLKERLSKIESLLTGKSQNQNSKTITAPVTVVSLSSAKIEQNVPNPFSYTTTVNYFIPEQTQTAHILIKGPKGEMIRNINLNSAGTGQLILDTKNLNQGLYYYSLVIDGEIIDTKKMVLNR